MNPDPHQAAAVVTSGPALKGSAGVVILLHGRGGSADNILSLARAIDLPQLSWLAPQASGNTWYPNSFMAPRESNEPWLSSALSKVASLVEIAESEGVSAARIAIGGFSQGACLATEFVASHPRRYAALFALTGGLVGPAGAELAHEGTLNGMPALFASSDPDPHVPWSRVEESARTLGEMGAQVTLRRYENRGHTIGDEEVGLVRLMLQDSLLPR